jgi:glycosyltransferase involved in cell wall biosynthesis
MDQKDQSEPHQQERLPVLSVAIPTYNRAETLRRQLGSLLGQIVGCQEDVEVVVSDNASSDSTGSVVAEMRAHFPDIRYVRNEANLGSTRNIDLAVRACRADYVWIVGDDDVLMPFAVETVVGAVEGAERSTRPASFIFLNAFAVAPDDTWLRPPYPPLSLLESGPVENAGDIFLRFPYESIGHITRLVVRRRDWIASPFIVAGPYEVWGVIRHLLTIGGKGPAYFVESPLIGGRKKHSAASYSNHVALARCIELPSYDLRLIKELGLPRHDVARAQRRRWWWTVRALVKVNLFEEYARYWPKVDGTRLLTIEGRLTQSAIRLLLRRRPWSDRIRRYFERRMGTPIETDGGLHDVV